MRYQAMLAGATMCSLLSGTALAGAVITLKTTGSDEAATSTISLESDRLRMSNPQEEIIYRTDLHKVWMIHPSDHTYRELTPESMQQMRSQMSAAMAQMQQSLQSMPPEQRKQIEAMMAKRGMPAGGPAQPRQVTWTKAGGSKTVGQWSCTPYKMSVNGVEQVTMCIAKLSEVGLTRDDLKAFISFGSFMQQGLAGVAAQAGALYDFDAMSKQIGFDGVPVETTHAEPGGREEIVGTLQSVEHKSIPADAFELPAGYTKQEMPPMGPRGMPSGGRPPAE
ncbi:MAG TPA: DUF4412 domain-containing protein [Alphaproteobacteria bacterium]|nr:DUF4412 domain-containing protein [Alphaproteobacteria bacterium]